MYPQLKPTPITAENLNQVHPQAARSLFWEMEGQVAKDVATSGAPTLEKEAWLARTLLDDGPCGFNLMLDEARGRGQLPGVGSRAVATILYCHPYFAPGAGALPTAPVSADAYLATSLFIDAGFAGVGLETVLLDACLTDLTARRVPAVEAFAVQDEVAEAEPEVTEIAEHAREIGMFAYEVLRGAGFTVTAQHPRVPRLRLELPPAGGLLTDAAVDDLLACALARV